MSKQEYCTYCQEEGHSVEDCWCTRPVNWNSSPTYKHSADVISNLLAPKEEKPFGYWHQGETEDESEFFLYEDIEDSDCSRCIPLYTRKKKND